MDENLTNIAIMMIAVGVVLMILGLLVMRRQRHRKDKSPD